MATIQELHGAVLKAQRDMDRHAESVAVPALVEALSPRPRVNGKTAGDLQERFWSKIVFGMSDCWFWRAATDDAGYGWLQNKRAHRVSWELHHGPIPHEMKVLHRCDVRNCVNPEHLFLGTQADNVADMKAKGRGRNVPQYGESNPMHALTTSDVLSIRADFAEGRATIRELAKRYGVAVMTIHRVIRRQSWTTI